MTIPLIFIYFLHNPDNDRNSLIKEMFNIMKQPNSVNDNQDIKNFSYNFI